MTRTLALLLILAMLLASSTTVDIFATQPREGETTPNTIQSPRPETTQAGSQIFLPQALSRSRGMVPELGVALEGYNSGSGLDKALELNVYWGRRWQPISWRDVEPNEDDYHWEALASLEDELLQAHAVGIQPILEIQFTPPWAQLTPPYSCGPIRADKFDAFASFLEQLIHRYGSASPYGVRYWQLGNEPDVAPEEIGPDSPFGCWGDPDDPFFGGGHYAEMLKVVYPRIKAADPQAQVMMAGLLLGCDPYSPSPGVDCRNETRWKSGLFLEGVLQAGGGDFFDIADVHSYALMRPDLPSRMHSYYTWSSGLGGTGLPEKATFVRNVLAKYGYPGKPLFAGELALKCEEPTAECYDVAAAFIPRAYAEAYDLNLLGGVYYTLISPDDYINRYKGLLRPDFSPRPMFWAYKYVSSQLVNAQYLGPVTGYTGLSGSAFERPDGRVVHIVWSTDGTDQTIGLPSNFAGAYDKLGNTITPTGNLLTVGWSPIYIEQE